MALMNETTLLVAFIAVTSVAVVLQTVILAGMYFSTRKMGQSVEALSARVNDQVLPLLEKARVIVDESTPMIEKMVTNLTETSTLVREQAGKIDEAVTEIVGIARTQAGNANILATRTMQRVDIAAEALQHTVTTPARRISALMEGVMAGFGQFVGGRKAQKAKGAQPDDMFI